MAILSTSVQHEQRIAHPLTLDMFCTILPGSALDVGTAVAANLYLCSHAAQGYAYELVVRGARWIHERGLALRLAGRLRHWVDRGLELVHALLHREVLMDALLDFLQAAVILLQNLFGL